MLTRGEKSIISLLAVNDFGLSKFRLNAMMFLISKRIPIYYFISSKHGLISFQLCHELSELEERGLLARHDEMITLRNEMLPPIENKIKNIIKIYTSKFSSMDDKTLNEYINHDCVSNVFGNRNDFAAEESNITTIGYEGKTIDEFLNELIKNKIDILIDVRRNPYSLKFGFKKNLLKNYLEKLEIEYIHMPELGIPSKDRKNLRDSADYQNLFEMYKKNIENKHDILFKIKDISETKKISLMCFEKDVRLCHRGILADQLRQYGSEVVNL